MKRFIQFFSQLLLVFFVCFGFNFSVFGQTQNEEEEEIIEVDGCTMNLDEGVEIIIEDIEMIGGLMGCILITDVTAIEAPREDEEILCIVEQSAIFEGGMDYFKEIVNNQIRFSDTMKECRVFIQFVVNEEGKVSVIKIVKGLSEENDKEALRIMNLISEHYDWIPAKQRDKTVKVRMNIPIVFKRKEKVKSNTERIYVH